MGVTHQLGVCGTCVFYLCKKKALPVSAGHWLSRGPVRVPHLLLAHSFPQPTSEHFPHLGMFQILIFGNAFRYKLLNTTLGYFGHWLLLALCLSPREILRRQGIPGLICCFKMPVVAIHTVLRAPSDRTLAEYCSRSESEAGFNSLKSQLCQIVATWIFRTAKPSPAHLSI